MDTVSSKGFRFTRDQLTRLKEVRLAYLTGEEDADEFDESSSRWNFVKKEKLLDLCVSLIKHRIWVGTSSLVYFIGILGCRKDTPMATVAAATPRKLQVQRSFGARMPTPEPLSFFIMSSYIRRNVLVSSSLLLRRHLSEKNV